MCATAVNAETIDQESGEHESALGHENAHGHHKNVFSIFVGLTHTGRRENSAALGIAYQRILNESFNIGVLVEHTFGDDDFTVYAVPLVFRLDRWRFYVAPGIEDSRAHGTESLLRIGTEYAYEAGSWEISPQLAIDFVAGEEVLVLGVVFGKGF